MIPRGLSRLAVLPFAFIVAAVCSAQGNAGVILSEVVHGPSVGPSMPSYVELVNVQIANPVVPPPVPIGSPAAGPATLSASVNGQPFQTFAIPVGPVLGGNVQPLPSVQPAAPPAYPPVMLVASGPFPPGTVPPGVVVVLAPALFTGINSQLGAPGIPFELCFNNIHLGPATATNCAVAPFTNTNTFLPATGRAIRWCYVDSNTDLDFDAQLAISPGLVNPQMTHVNGFTFGTVTSSLPAGVPLTLTGGAMAGTLSFPATARVRAVNFQNGYLARSIANPAFDAIINAPVTMTAGFTAQSPALTNQPFFLPGLSITGELLQIIVSSPLGTAFLNMPMNVSTQTGTNVVPSAAAPFDVRPERVFCDLTTAPVPFITGTIAAATAAERDVIPLSTGGGDVWCQAIVYDAGCNQYRAKGKNWAPGGACGGPMLALGTDAAGSGTLIDLCFAPGAMVANIFSAVNPSTCGGPLLPSGGICPDALTSMILTPPQLGSPPYFVTTDAAGIYLFQVPAPTLVGLIGQTFWGIAVEFTLPGTIVQQSVLTSLTF
jgi:hypothetical protein